ncbi:MAG: hypothetical protein HYS27_21910 [Deltaproteobacteria bacterium]|nr:hypothetical protein [Deltaproteobacteria bacterium]
MGLFRSPFRRAQAPALARPPPSEAARACAAATGLPLALADPLATATDEGARFDDRRRAVTRLERGAGAHAVAVARLLVPVLSAAPDLASHAHLALLSLAPDLAVGRDPQGALCAAARPLSQLPHDGAAGRVEPGLGRVVGLDALAALFGPEEQLPAFLSRPGRAAPAPYRPPEEVLERRRREQQAVHEREQRRVLLSALELEEDDLDDDPEDHLAHGERHQVARRDAPVLAVVPHGAEVVLASVCQGSGERRLSLGVAHAGEWWSDLRVGDHHGAERWHVRLVRETPPARPTVRKAPRLAAPDGVVVLQLGSERVEQVIGSRTLLPFVEHDGELVVGITLVWSSHSTRVR